MLDICTEIDSSPSAPASRLLGKTATELIKLYYRLPYPVINIACRMASKLNDGSCELCRALAGQMVLITKHNTTALTLVPNTHTAGAIEHTRGLDTRSMYRLSVHGRFKDECHISDD